MLHVLVVLTCCDCCGVAAGLVHDAELYAAATANPTGYADRAARSGAVAATANPTDPGEGGCERCPALADEWCPHQVALLEAAALEVTASGG
jgi:hypothetical protein